MRQTNTAEVLTPDELQDLNERMLGLGAPNVIDFQGYNKFDYGKMHNIWLNSTSPSDKECAAIANTLIKYTKTQLVDIADRVLATVKSYNDRAMAVRVVSVTNDGIQLSWLFNKAVSAFIKTKLAKGTYRWSKDAKGTWILTVPFSTLQKLQPVMEQNGLNTSAIELAKLEANITINDETDTPAPYVAPVVDNPHVLTFTVSRPDNTVDTLAISSKYNEELIELYKTLDGSWNKVTKAWEVPIFKAAELYKGIQAMESIETDATELKPWADMIDSWGKGYDLLDVSKLHLKFTPYDFQPKDAARLLAMRVGLNANEMGTGKTFESVLIGESILMPKLVICPPTLRLNWVREIRIVNPKAKIHVQYSNEDFETVDGWNIIGYNSLDKFSAELEDKMFQVIMIDEAHYIQAIDSYGKPESKRAFNVLRLCATAEYVFPMTGTPKTSRNKNLFNILRVIRHPLALGKFAFLEYGKTYCAGYKDRWGWDFSGNSNDDELFQQLNPYMVRHLKRDVLPDLKKQRIAIPVEIDLREYHKAIQFYLDNRKNRDNEDLVRLTKAKQTVAIRKANHSIEFAKDIVDQGQKVVIVTCFTEVIEKVEAVFQGNCVKVVGGMSDKAKTAAVDEFQKGDTQVMVINVVAGGVGITLTAAHIMIMNDVPWTSGELTQAEDRICRGGQTESCIIYYPVAIGCDMDEQLVEVITNKSNTINDAIDDGLGETVDLRDLVEKAIRK